MSAFSKSKWLLCPLALCVSLLLILRLWLFSSAEEPSVFHLTVKAEGVDNLLCEALLEVFETEKPVLLGRTAGRLIEASASPSRILDGEGGYFSSSLSSDLFITLYLPLTKRDGSYYAEGEYLAVGESVLLLADAFRLEGRLSAISDPLSPK